MSQTNDRRLLPRLGHILLLVVAVSAQTPSGQTTGVRLADFQVIASNSVPQRCIQAYDKPMAACTRNDFRSGQPCSDECTRDVENTERSVQAACQGVSIAANTVLGNVLQGRLVPLLCPPIGGDGSTTRQPARQSTTVQPPRSTPVAAEPSDPNQPAPAPIRTTAPADPSQSRDAPSSTPTVEREILPGGSPFDVPQEQRASSAHVTIQRWACGWALVSAAAVFLLR